MKIAFGTYTGDDVDGQTITIGAGWGTPTFVWIWSDHNASAVWRNSSMAGDNSFECGDNAEGGLTANYIQSLVANGFTIGTDTKVNLNPNNYYYMAIADTAADFDVGTYTGDGNDNRDIDTNCGYTPLALMVQGDGAYQFYFRVDSMAANEIYDVQAGVHVNKFDQMVADGFRIDSHAQINNNGDTYYYVIWQEVNGICNDTSFTGDGADNRSITVTGMAGVTPDFVLLQNDNPDNMIVSSNDMGADETVPLADTGIEAANWIQAFEVGGFQVGSGGPANRDTKNVYGFILETGDTAVGGVAPTGALYGPLTGPLGGPI